MALENYQHASLLDAQNFPVLKEYGLYLQQVGQTQRAQAALSQAYRIDNTDAQVNDSLRQMGIVPGPSLKERDELARPVLPKGPLDLDKIKSGLGLGGGQNNSVQPTPASSLQAPRD
jgi:hypothetical protein